MLSHFFMLLLLFDCILKILQPRAAWSEATASGKKSSNIQFKYLYNEKSYTASLSLIDSNLLIPLSSIVTPYTVSAASIVPFLCVITKN